MTATIETAVDLRDKAPELDIPRNLRKYGIDEVMSLLGSLLGSFALVWVAYYDMLPWAGALGFIICWYFVFLGMYASVTPSLIPDTW